jgi:hypothetical protein
MSQDNGFEFSFTMIPLSGYTTCYYINYIVLTISQSSVVNNKTCMIHETRLFRSAMNSVQSIEEELQVSQIASVDNN